MRNKSFNYIYLMTFQCIQLLYGPVAVVRSPHQVAKETYLAVRLGAWGTSSARAASAALAVAEVEMLLWPLQNTLPQLQRVLPSIWVDVPRVTRERPATLEKERPALPTALNRV
jgi:hypothetical protein